MRMGPRMARAENADQTMKVLNLRRKIKRSSAMGTPNTAVNGQPSKK